jgi:hypothetical protein
MLVSLLVAYKHFASLRRNPDRRAPSIFMFLPKTIVLLFSWWLVKSAVYIYQSFHLLQFLNVVLIVTAFSIQLWI